MTLTLTILRSPPNVPPEVRQVSGGELTIGRGPDNDWVLPDPEKHLSKRHCVIAFRRGEWQVAGISTNGTFLNRDEEPLEAGTPRGLGDGDRLRLGSYEIEVRVASDPSVGWRRGGVAPPMRSDPFDDPFGDAGAGMLDGAPDRPAPDDGHSLAILPAEFDPLAADAEAFAGPTRPDHAPALSDAAYVPPASTLPDDWDLSRVGHHLPVPPSREQAPTGAPDRAASAASGEDGLLAAFLRGAGMDNVKPSDPEKMMEELGAAFRAAVAGIRETLIARSGIKREFRIEGTEIRPRGNNPLKFSADDDDALAAVLGAGRRSDMRAEVAIGDALEDIRLHELATVAAMQSAVRSVVARLGPEQVRATAEPSGALRLPGSGKARAWDAYEVLHSQVTRGLSDDFDSVFGKSFARAYEQAVKELGRSDRQGRRRR